MVAAVGALVIAALCPMAAQAAWEKYGHPWDLKFDPYVYGAGFGDAVTMRLIRLQTGQSYFEFRGDDTRHYASPNGGHRLCTLGDMPRAWLDDPRLCKLTQSKYEADCRLIDGCAILGMSPDVLRTYRAPIVEALENPCGYFDDADALRRSLPRERQDRELRRQGPGDLTIERRWRLFECRSSSPIRAKVDLRDSDQGLIRLRF